MPYNRFYILALISLISYNALADEPKELHFDKPVYKGKEPNKIILSPNKDNKLIIAAPSTQKSPAQQPIKEVNLNNNSNNSLNQESNLIKPQPILPPEINVNSFSDDIINIDNTNLNNKFSKNTSSLWSRIRSGFSIPDLVDELSDNRTKWYAERPEYFLRINARAEKYLYHIVEELEKRHMPLELALLPIIESAFNPTANSSVKAAGIWQFMPKTGKYFNLQQNMFIDERRDVLSSTTAALDYLAKLHNMFGDWHLALAAYNWGEGSVARAIARNQAKGLPTDYLSLSMPTETRYYVPKLQGVKNIIANPEKYNITLNDIPNHPYFVTITTSKDIDVEVAARLAEMSISEFKAINPSFNKPVIIGATKPQILLPWNKAEKFQTNLKNYQFPLSTVTAITLGGRENVENLAKRFGIEADTIRKINNIGKGFRFKAGSTVLMPKVGSLQSDISEHIAENGRISTEREVAQMKKVYVFAHKGDSLINIARRYDISVNRLASWNKVRKLKRGQKIMLIIPANKTITPVFEEKSYIMDLPKLKEKSKPAIIEKRDRKVNTRGKYIKGNRKIYTIEKNISSHRSIDAKKTHKSHNKTKKH